MTSILLVVIYLAFISLGLPDSLLGSAWPSMYPQMGVPLSYAGMISMIIAGGTIVSSLLSDRLIRRFGTGLVTLVSVAMTAVALMGFSASYAFWHLCLFGIPYGLGAGSVDAALNNFVALHYKSRHMSWLHCFWGIGATAGPYIMGYCLTGGLSWNAGYRSVGFIQIALVACLALSLPLWKKNDTAHNAIKRESSGGKSGGGFGNKDSGAAAGTGFSAVSEPGSSAAAGTDGSAEAASSRNVLSLRQAISLPCAKAVLLSFLGYCGLESTTGLWASSYLVMKQGFSAETAAGYASLFFLGITLGRLASGFVSDSLGDRNMVRIGLGVILIGILVLLLPAGDVFALIGIFCIGLGCAPIYPSLLHATPSHFGAENSQSLMGMQMATAYVGSTFMPPLFGALSGITGLWFYPVYLALFLVLMIAMTEWVNRRAA
ncbi:MAG: MFS transporter [Eubacteriales bacterium]|nr:MFS transporter [Eubacteriales bacterium]